MQADTKTIKKNFQKSFEKYNANAIVQRVMAEKLSGFVVGKNFDSILEIGAGTGFLTEFLVKNITFENYYANDLVEKSESFVKKYVENVKFLGGDFKRLKLNKKFDLIASNAVFQWFEKVDTVFEICKKNMNPDSEILFSTFSPENYKEIKSVSGLTLNYLTEDELKTSLEKYFEIIKFEKFKETMSFDNPLKILAHMKNTGVNSLSKTPWSIKDIKNFCNRYQEMYPGLDLTYSYFLIYARNIN